MGEIYVGFSCLEPNVVDEIAQWHMISANGYITRFCDTQPPEVTLPQYPGGQCRSVIPTPTSTLVVEGDFDMTWYTIDGGGNFSAGGDFSLSSTSGQLDAGSMSGGDYSLSGGFWAETGLISNLYLPLIQH